MDKNQITELVVERRRAPAPAAPNVMNRPLPRSVTIPLLVLLAYAVLMGLINFPVLHVYQKHFRETLPKTSVPWQSLSPALDEPALRALFPGLPLRCMADGGTMGDRVCFAAVEEVDGYPALTIALFLRKGRLTLATVHVPWWGHGRAAEALARLGPSEPASGGTSTRLRRYIVANGVVDMNERRSFNLLSWSAIVWTPRGGA